MSAGPKLLMRPAKTALALMLSDHYVNCDLCYPAIAKRSLRTSTETAVVGQCGDKIIPLYSYNKYDYVIRLHLQLLYMFKEAVE